MSHFEKIAVLIGGLFVAGAATVFADDLTVTSFDQFAGETNILLQAGGNITFSGGGLTLPDLPVGTAGLLSVRAGNDIVIQNPLTAGLRWSIFLQAGNDVAITNSGAVIASSGDINVSAGHLFSNFSSNWSGTANSGGSVMIGGNGQGSITIITKTPEPVYIGSGLPPQLIALNSPVNFTNITAVSGSGVILFAMATNSLPLCYQWYKSSTNIIGETNQIFSLSDIHRTNAGYYSMIASNALGVFTNNVNLHVVVPQLLRAGFNPTNHGNTIDFGDADGGTPTAGDVPRFVIQTSTNLVDWTSANLPISTNANGGFLFEPLHSADADRIFYRVLSQ